MDQYFLRIERLSKNTTIASRVRFMLRDVVDLRANNWVPRRDDNNPKTIAEIHQEAQEEKDKQQIQLARMAQENRQQGRRSDRQDRGQRVDADGWQSVPAKANSMDPNKMKITKQQLGDDIQLGPGRGFGGWGRGASAGRVYSQEADRPQASMNR